MPPDRLADRVIAFVNVAHALDHFLLLIFPTAVIAIAAERGLAYGELIGLTTGTFVAFGLLSLPVGWLADRVGRRNLLAAFFLGSGAACFGMATAATPLGFALWLLILGCFAAIYHPVGSALLVTHARRLGRDLGRNGVWGNMGAAFASGITALVAANFGWRAAFAAPGVVCLAAGLAFLAMVPAEANAARKASASDAKPLPVSRPAALAVLFLIAVVGGGITFNIATIALPKVIDERLGFDIPLGAVGMLATSVFILGAVTQVVMGRLVDRIELPWLFLALSVCQPVGLAIAAATLGAPMLAGMVLSLAAIYGQVVINDAMIARYVAPELRSRAFGIRYFLGFSVAALAVPMIGILHGRGGFAAVLGGAAIFGAMILASAIGFFLLTRPPRTAETPVELA